MYPKNRHPKVYDLTSEPGFIDDSTLAPVQNDSGPGVDLIALQPFDVKVLRRALKRLRHEANRDALRNAERGWTPEPGKQDVIKLTLDAISGLLARLPMPPRPEDRS